MISVTFRNGRTTKFADRFGKSLSSRNPPQPLQLRQPPRFDPSRSRTAKRLNSPLTKSSRRSSATSPKGGLSHLALLPLDVIDPPRTMRVEAPGHEKR